jgi:tetratricopeptide (TPR) repeat protein
MPAVMRILAEDSLAGILEEEDQAQQSSEIRDGLVAETLMLPPSEERTDVLHILNTSRAFNLLRLERWQEALDAFSKVSDSIDVKQRSAAYCGAVLCAYKLSRSDLAAAFYGRAEKPGIPPEWQALAYFDLGCIEHHHLDYAAAKDLFIRSADSFRQFGGGVSRGEIYRMLAKTLRSLGDDETSEEIEARPKTLQN